MRPTALVRLRKVCLVAAATFLLWFLISLAMYRLPSGEQATVFVGEVEYQVLELGLTNRELFESFLGNRYSLVFLDGAPALYVSKSDRQRLWPEDLFVAQEKTYSLRATIHSPPLLFGGYGRSEVLGLERVEKPPRFRK